MGRDFGKQKQGWKGRWEVKLGRKVGKGLREGRFGREGERMVGKGRWEGRLGREGGKGQLEREG